MVANLVLKTLKPVSPGVKYHFSWYLRVKCQHLLNHSSAYRHAFLLRAATVSCVCDEMCFVADFSAASNPSGWRCGATAFDGLRQASCAAEPRHDLLRVKAQSPLMP